MSRLWYEFYCKYSNSKCIIFDVKNVYIGPSFENFKKLWQKSLKLTILKLLNGKKFQMFHFHIWTEWVLSWLNSQITLITFAPWKDNFSDGSLEHLWLQVSYFGWRPFLLPPSHPHLTLILPFTSPNSPLKPPHCTLALLKSCPKFTLTLPSLYPYSPHT